MADSSSVQYYMVIDEKSTGPYTLDEITLHPRLTPETLVWKPGIENWTAAKNLAELTPAFAKQAPQVPPNVQNEPPRSQGTQYNDKRNDYYGNESHSRHNERHQNYQHNNYNNQYRNGYRNNLRTNWLPWAIVATVVGFFTSCIGAIFGIVGIVQANRANTLYSQGMDMEGDAANSNAKVMTIIGLIFAGLGIVALFWMGNIFTNLMNLAASGY